MDTLVTLALVSHIFIAIVIFIVGTFLVITLIKLRLILDEAHQALQALNSGIDKTIETVQNLNSNIPTLQAGIKTLDSIVTWMKEKKNSPAEDK